MDPLFDEEAILLKRYREGDESALKSLITRHQKKVFALVFYSVGCSRDQAYEITVASFVGAIRQASSFSGKNPFLRTLVRLAISNVQGSKTILSPNQIDSSESRSEKKEIYRIVKRALLGLSFDIRVFLLLRDQMNLPYEDISSILEVSQGNVKAKLTQARTQLREKIESMVNHLESL